MAKSLDEFLDWLDAHPKAELTVAEDVWDYLEEMTVTDNPNIRPLLLQRIDGRPIQQCTWLKPGTILGMEKLDLFRMPPDSGMEIVKI